MDSLLLIGNSLMMLLAMFSLLSSVILFVKVMKSQEYRDIKYTKRLNKDLTANVCSRMHSGVLVSKGSIYECKYADNSPCNLEKLEIDDRCLSKNSTVLINKGD